MTQLSSSTQDARMRPDIRRAKYRFGLAYGIAAGLGFALSNWGMDAYLLSQAHALQPWMKVIVAILVCVPVGGLAGWFSTRLDRPLISVLIWLAAGGIFAWLSVANTFQIYPALLGSLIPETRPFLNYSIYDILETNGVMVYVWTSIFWSIVGLIQQPLLDQAVFSFSIFSKLTPFIVILALILVAGLFVDNLNNEPLRSPMLALDTTVQFAIDSRDQEVDRATARMMHIAATRTISDWLDLPRHYYVSSFDEFLGVVNIIADFEGNRANCTVVYNQASYCKPLTP